MRHDILDLRDSHGLNIPVADQALLRGCRLMSDGVEN